MNEKAQLIAIAEACGWVWVLADMRPGYLHYAHWKPPAGWRMLDEDSRESAMAYPPDYLNDLNAMHEAWKTLSMVEHHAFRFFLAMIVRRDGKTMDNPHASVSCAMCSQRREAFLKAKSLWEE